MEEQPRPKAGCVRRLIQMFLGIVLILVVLGIIGSIYENQAEASFLEENPPPGELIDVGGRNLHINCTGEGSPTIILDAGLGGWSIDFVDIQAELAQTNRVCSYDRAGYGWSDPADDERRIDDIATDLHRLLSNAEIEQPYVLVGFSFSGLSSRYYYGQYSDELAGLVLIDPSHEGDSDTLPEELLAAQQSLPGMYGLFGSLAQVGLIRILNPAEMSPYAPFIPTDPISPDLYYAGLANPDWWTSSRKEFATNQFAEMPALPTAFEIPVTIIGLTESIPDEAYADLSQAHLDLLQGLADGSENVELVVFEGISHDDIIRETDIVVYVIHELLEDQ